MVNLQVKFLEALSECKTEEEIRNLSRFIREVSKTGGYAVKFYNDNVTLINKSGVIDAKKELEVRKEEKKKPILKVILRLLLFAVLKINYCLLCLPLS